MTSSRHLIASLALCATGGVLAQPLVIEYVDKPPYTYTLEGRPAGFLLERTALLLRRAGLEGQFAEVPFRRSLLNFQSNRVAMCSPGLYKTPERETFLRYSLPIHRDRAHVVLANLKAAPRIREMTRISQLLGDPSLQVGVLNGMSHGRQLDQMLAQMPHAPVRAQLTPLQLVRMVAAQRVDYMMIDDEDLNWLSRDPEFQALPLARIEFADMPRGELRYLACSLQTSPQTMDRLNQAIRELGPELRSD